MSKLYRYFDISEFDCSHTGNNEMKHGFLLKLDTLRYKCGFPFKITSGYRDKTHPIEAAKKVPGMHSTGMAADIAVSNGAEKYKILQEALALGFTGIGIADTFIHVDTRITTPVVWSY